MKRLFVLAALCCSSLFLSMPVSAKKPGAQNINFGAITCSEFMKELSQGSAEDAGVVLMWIDGYLSGVSGDTVLKWATWKSSVPIWWRIAVRSPTKRCWTLPRRLAFPSKRP
jgi:acid stress chaperone HdeB